MKKILLTSIAFFFIIFSVLAQSVSREVASSSGETYTNSSGSLSWTIGEPNSQTFSSSSNFITQGFHQTKLEITSVEENTERIKMKVYPNPTHEYLNLEFSGKHPDYSVNLYDFRGKLIKDVSVDNAVSNKIIDISAEAAGTYLLKVSAKNGKTMNTYKIQKLKY